MKKCLFSMLLTGILLASCQGSEEYTETGCPESDGIVFRPSIESASRATDTSFDNADQISVFAIESTGTNPDAKFGTSDLYVSNSKYTYQNQSFMASDAGITFPQGDAKLGFHAIYPYDSQIPVPRLPLYEFTVDRKQNENGKYTKSDLMTAYTVSENKETVPLTFSHKLSKVIINLTTENLPSGNPQVTLSDVYISTRINLNTNSFESIGGTTNIVMASNGTLSFKCIVAPQTVYKDQVLATIDIGGYTYLWTLEKTVEWHSGVEYSYNLRFSKASVRFYSDILPWGHMETIDDVVPPEIQDKIEPYIPIYKGHNPPNVQGAYLSNVSTLVYSSGGGFKPGDTFADMYFRFMNQDMVNNTLDYDEKQGRSFASGPGSFISGEDDNFTAYFNTVGESYGIYVKTAIVISGVKTSSGIKNYRYAFIMLEKGNDPEKKLVDVGTFRVFKDGNELASFTSWPLKTVRMRSSGLPEHIEEPLKADNSVNQPFNK